MGFRKAFRATPVMLGAYYRRKQRADNVALALRMLGVAATGGAIIGVASVAATPSGRAEISQTLGPLAVQLGIVRARSPQPGDFWNRCDDARHFGTAPIYAGEPGYREGLDRDGDGIACEPFRGS